MDFDSLEEQLRFEVDRVEEELTFLETVGKVHLDSAYFLAKDGKVQEAAVLARAAYEFYRLACNEQGQRASLKVIKQTRIDFDELGQRVPEIEGKPYAQFFADTLRNNPKLSPCLTASNRIYSAACIHYTSLVKRGIGLFPSKR